MASTLFLEHICEKVFDKSFILSPKAGSLAIEFLYTLYLSLIVDYY